MLLYDPKRDLELILNFGGILTLIPVSLTTGCDIHFSEMKLNEILA